MKSSEYWAKRQLEVHKAIANKTIRQSEKQLRKYYQTAMYRVLNDFEQTYDKILSALEEGKEATPADLYKLDKYWQMQAQLKEELQKLGDKEVALLSKEFEKEWQKIYDSTAVPSDVAFSTISTNSARAMIDTVWLTDGKHFSERIWRNMDNLTRTLNENLMHCVVTGKKTTELRKLLMKRFKVARYCANRILRTEVAHIQTEAAKQRYQDYGLTKYKFLADSDERTCKGSHSCEELDGKIFPFNEMQAGVNAPPMHPNCRCAIIAVIE